MTKLGEALVKKGTITKEHLKLALERQVVFGGRIGTNIIELGILKEDELTKFLSKFLKVPAVSPAELSEVDEETIGSITREHAEKYRFVPFRKEKNRLHVALMDYDVRKLDELRFVTSYDILPYMTSELRLLYALEKYYGIKRDLRFISILDREGQEPDDQTRTDEAMMKTKEAFIDVADREEVAGLVVNEARKVAKRAALFLVRSNHVAGWKSSGVSVEGFELQANVPSLFYEVLMKKSYYRGPVLKIPGNEEIISVLGGTPQDSLVFPINIRDRVIAILYADNGNRDVLSANLTYINSLCQMAALSFELLILKKKMMDL